MTLIDYIVNHPATSLLVILSIGIILLSSNTLHKSNKSGLAILLLFSVGVISYQFVGNFKESLRLSKIQTIVVMPNEQNIRLGEDGQPSFCLDGMARTWKGTSDGIISTQQRMYLGKPMRCLSVEEGIGFLRKNGATEQQLSDMRDLYKVSN